MNLSFCFLIVFCGAITGMLISKFYIIIKIHRLQKKGLYPRSNTVSKLPFIEQLIVHGEVNMACHLYRQEYGTSLLETHKQILKLSKSLGDSPKAPIKTGKE